MNTLKKESECTVVPYQLQSNLSIKKNDNKKVALEN